MLFCDGLKSSPDNICCNIAAEFGFVSNPLLYPNDVTFSLCVSCIPVDFNANI